MSISSLSVANFPLEVELLICCLRLSTQPSAVERMETLIEEGPNWLNLFNLAKHHKVLPLVCRGLSIVRFETIPSAVLDEVKGYRREWAVNNLLLTGELLKVIDLLESQGLEVVPFKGPLLAETAYGDISLRDFGDLDLLIRERDIVPALELLRSRRYRIVVKRWFTSGRDFTSMRAAGPLRSSRFRLNYDCLLACPDSDAHIELHWRLLPWFFAPAFQSELLWGRLETANLRGRTVKAMPLEEFLLFLCMHATKHCWNKMQFVCDLTQLAHVYGENIDWDHLNRQTRDLGAERMLGLGLCLAKDLLGLPLPDNAVRSWIVDPATVALAEHVRSRLFEPSGHTSFENTHLPLIGLSVSCMLHHLRAKERVRDRLRYSVGMGIGIALEAVRSDLFGDRVQRFLGLLRHTSSQR